MGKRLICSMFISRGNLFFQATYRHSVRRSSHWGSYVSLLEGTATSTRYNQSSDYFPVYFQACKGASPVTSGVYLLSFASLAPAIIITGISVKATGQYRVQTWIGWILTIIGLGSLSVTLTTDYLTRSLGCLVMLGSGIGCVVPFSSR